MSQPQISSQLMMDAIRKELISRREQLGWSVQRLANEMNAGWNHVRDLEEGITQSPSVDTILRWAEALGMEMRVTFRSRNLPHKVVQKKTNSVA